MSLKLAVSFAPTHSATGGLAILLTTSGAEMPAGASEADPAGVYARAAKAAKFTGKALATLDIVAPHGSPLDRMVVIGLGKGDALAGHDWLKAGGVATAALKGAEKVVIYMDVPGDRKSVV